MVDYTKSSTDKDNYEYTQMIQQPYFVDQALFDAFQKEVIKKGKKSNLLKVYYQEITEVLVCQMFHKHKGSYKSEHETFKQMEDYLREHGYQEHQITQRDLHVES